MQALRLARRRFARDAYLRRWLFDLMICFPIALLATVMPSRHPSFRNVKISWPERIMFAAVVAPIIALPTARKH
jgi:hypothetical protein